MAACDALGHSGQALEALPWYSKSFDPRVTQRDVQCRRRCVSGRYRAVGVGYRRAVAWAVMPVSPTSSSFFLRRTVSNRQTCALASGRPGDFPARPDGGDSAVHRNGVPESPKIIHRRWGIAATRAATEAGVGGLRVLSWANSVVVIGVRIHALLAGKPRQTCSLFLRGCRAIGGHDPRRNNAAANRSTIS